MKYLLNLILISMVLTLFSADLTAEKPSEITTSFKNFPQKIEGKENVVEDALKPVDYVPEQTETIDNDKQTLTQKEWNLIDSLSVTLDIPANSLVGVLINQETKKMQLLSPYIYTENAMKAINKVPLWLKVKLQTTFGLLDGNLQDKYADIILNTEHPYIDEVAFAIAYSSPKYLRSSHSYSKLFTENAELIYTNDEFLDYVEVKDYGSPNTNPEYYSTVVYKKKNESGEIIDVEVPMDVYYMYIVHPKITDEIQTYVDPDYMEYLPNTNDRTNNIKSPDNGGVFWRTYLFNHTEKKPNSEELFELLKEEAQKAEILWNDQVKEDSTAAIWEINDWVRDVLEFTSEQERPHQPVRIYDLHIGRCGEHEDLTAAAARSCLIPCRGVERSSTDHVWNEFWDEGVWEQWEPVNNWIKVKHKEAKPHVGSCSARESEGKFVTVTEDYVDPQGKVSNLKFNVMDRNKKPLDGAIAIMYIKYTNPDNPDEYTFFFDAVGVTNNKGIVEFEVGTQREYFIRVNSAIGSSPQEQNKIRPVIIEPDSGKTHAFNIFIANEKPESKAVKADFNEEQEMAYKIEASLNNVQEITNYPLVLNDLSGENIRVPNEETEIDVYMIKADQLANIEDKEEYEYLLREEGIKTGNTVEMMHPKGEQFFVFFDNSKNLRNFVRVNAKINAYFDPIASVDDEIAELKAVSAYPNPFNEKVNIIYSLNENAQVKLNIYDASGNSIATLKDEFQNAGEHRVSWNTPSRLASGTYYYELSINGEHKTGQIKLIK